MSFSRRAFLKMGSAGLLARFDHRRSWISPLIAVPGIQLYTVSDALRLDTVGTLRTIHSIGYREVESSGFGTSSAADFRRALDETGLRCIACHVNFTNGQNEQLFSDAHTVGAKYVVSSTLINALAQQKSATRGSITSSTIHVDDFKWMADLANRFGLQASRAKLYYAYHNHNFEFVHVGSQVGYDIIIENTEPNLVNLEIDCGWMKLAGHDPVQYLRKYGDRVRMLHIKDFVKPIPPSTEIRGHQGTELGRGFIDYRPILLAAKRAKVAHYFVEQEPPFKNMTSLEAARIDYDYLRSMK